MKEIQQAIEREERKREQIRKDDLAKTKEISSGWTAKCREFQLKQAKGI
jgi:hypothetical protein